MNGFLEKLARYFSINVFIKNVNIFGGKSRIETTRQPPGPIAITGQVQQRQPWQPVLGGFGQRRGLPSEAFNRKAPQDWATVVQQINGRAKR